MGDDERSGAPPGRRYVKRLRCSHYPLAEAYRSLQSEDHRTLHDEVDGGGDPLGDHERDDLNRELAQALSGEQSEQHAEQADLQGKGHRVQDHDRDESARGRRGPEGPASVDQICGRGSGYEGDRLGRCVPKPSAIKITSSPKSTIAEKPPVMMNRVSCAGSGRALSRSSTGSSTGCGWWGCSLINRFPASLATAERGAC